MNLKIVPMLPTITGLGGHPRQPGNERRQARLPVLILRTNRNLWSRDVARWCRCGLSVAGPFVRRCLTSLTMLPFPHPAHRTGWADFPLPALGERFTMSPTGDGAAAC